LIPPLSSSTAACPGRGWERSEASEQARPLVLVAAEWGERRPLAFQGQAWGWEPRGLRRISFFGGRGATSDADVAGTRHVARAGPLDRDGHSWPGSGRKVLEVRGRGPSRAYVSALSGGHVAGIGARRRAGWGPVPGGDVAGSDLTNGARRIHELKYCWRMVMRYRRLAFAQVVLWASRVL
jgi:hypothetical protein